MHLIAELKQVISLIFWPVTLHCDDSIAIKIFINCQVSLTFLYLTKLTSRSTTRGHDVSSLLSLIFDFKV